MLLRIIKFMSGSIWFISDSQGKRRAYGICLRDVLKELDTGLAIRRCADFSQRSLEVLQQKNWCQFQPRCLQSLAGLFDVLWSVSAQLGEPFFHCHQMPINGGATLRFFGQWKKGASVTFSRIVLIPKQATERDVIPPTSRWISRMARRAGKPPFSSFLKRNSVALLHWEVCSHLSGDTLRRGSQRVNPLQSATSLMNLYLIAFSFCSGWTCVCTRSRGADTRQLLAFQHVLMKSKSHPWKKKGLDFFILMEY